MKKEDTRDWFCNDCDYRVTHKKLRSYPKWPPNDVCPGCKVRSHVWYRECLL